MNWSGQDGLYGKFGAGLEIEKGNEKANHKER